MDINIVWKDGRDEVYKNVGKTISVPGLNILKIYSPNMHFDIPLEEVVFIKYWVGA